MWACLDAEGEMPVDVKLPSSNCSHHFISLGAFSDQIHRVQGKKRKYPIKVCKMHQQKHKRILKCLSSRPHLHLRTMQEHLPQTSTLGGCALHIVFQRKLEFFQVLFDHRHLTLDKHDVLPRKRQGLQPGCQGTLLQLTPCTQPPPPQQSK